MHLAWLLSGNVAPVNELDLVSGFDPDQETEWMLG